MIETKFKQTEIGVIPEGWEIIPLSTLGNVKMCKRIMKFQTSEVGDIPFYKIGTFGKSPDAFIPRELFEYYKSKYSYPHKGTILISAAGTIGRTVVFDGEDSYFQDSNIVWIDNDESIVLDRYLYCYFNIIKWQTENGGIVTRLYNDNLKSTFLAYPKDKQEQQRIAEALSNIDKLISSLSKMIEKKRLIKQGAMQQLLTGKKRLPGFNGEWIEIELGELLKYEQPQQYIVKDTEYLSTGIPVLTAGKTFILGYTCETNGVYEEVPIILFDDFTTASKYVNFKFKVKSSAAKILSLRDRKCNLRLIYELMQIINFPLTDHQRYWISEFSHIKIWIPDDYKEQNAIANVLSTMDNEIESLEEERDKYIRLKEGMMQKLLTGQIRLIEAETKRIAQPKAKVANVYFKRSVLAAEIADRLCEEQTFGHVKMEKLIFLTEHLCHIDIDSHYHRDAAGPYDNRALRSIDSQMKKQKWFEAKKVDKGYRYIPMQNRGGHKEYFEKYYADVMHMFEKVIDTFRSSTTEKCEIVATLYSAWNDLLKGHQSFSDDDILNEILNNWHESKKRISRSRWQAELNWMRTNDFVPQTDNH